MSLEGELPHTLLFFIVSVMSCDSDITCIMMTSSMAIHHTFLFIYKHVYPWIGSLILHHDWTHAFLSLLGNFGTRSLLTYRAATKTVVKDLETLRLVNRFLGVPKKNERQRRLQSRLERIQKRIWEGGWRVLAWYEVVQKSVFLPKDTRDVYYDVTVVLPFVVAVVYTVEAGIAPDPKADLRHRVVSKLCVSDPYRVGAVSHPFVK